MKIFAIDPGNEQSGYAFIEMPNFKLIEFGKIGNTELIAKLINLRDLNFDALAIEMIASYGMSVGREVFDTCRWIGRFEQAVSSERTVAMHYIYRRDEKLTLCGSLKAKDTNIRQALIDRYAAHDLRTGKGTKMFPDTFYGVSRDAWQAIAVGVTCYEMNYK